MKALFLYLVFILSCNYSTDCEIPKNVEKIISKQKRFDQGKAISINQISSLWKTSGGTEKIVCPNQVIGDFTKDGKKDIVLMYFDNVGIPYLVSVINYETKHQKFQEISGVNDYGNSGVGDALYVDKGNIYVIKLESSVSKITWRKNKFTINVIGD